LISVLPFEGVGLSIKDLKDKYGDYEKSKRAWTKKLDYEFLKLHPTLKNSHYKAPLHYFMEKYEFPFELNSKRGFAIRKPPLGRRVRQTVKDFFNPKR
jgi:hypothetical protein